MLAMEKPQCQYCFNYLHVLRQDCETSLILTNAFSTAVSSSFNPQILQEIQRKNNASI